jgi:hypothetical protein
MRAKPPNVKPKGWETMQTRSTMKGTRKTKDDQSINPRHGIDLRRYHMFIKKYKEDWRQDPHTKVLLDNLLHLVLSNS